MVVALLLLIFLCFCVRVVQLGYIYIYVYSLPGEYWYSSAVTKRIEERKVSTATGSIILRGTLDARLADKHGLNVVVFSFLPSRGPMSSDEKMMKSFFSELSNFF